MQKRLNTDHSQKYIPTIIKGFLCLFCLINAIIATAQIPLVPYRDGYKWGFADTSGKIKIPAFAQFMPQRFDEYGFALFRSESNHYGMIDTSGKTILKPEFIKIEVDHPYCIIGRYSDLGFTSDFNYNLSDSARLFYLNGQAIFKYAIQDYIFNSKISKRLMIVKNNNILLYDINWQTRTKRLISQFKNAYFDGYIYANGIIGFNINIKGSNGDFISKRYNINGQPIKPPSNLSIPVMESNTRDANWSDQTESYYEPLMDASNRQTPVIKKVGNKYTIDKDPEDLKAKFYDHIIPINRFNEFFLCQLNHQWGLVSKNSLEYIAPIWDTIMPCEFLSRARIQGYGNFLFNQWLVKKDGKWGIMSPDAPKFNIPVLYDSIIPENYNHYVVKQNGLWGAISDTGTTEIKCEVDLSYSGLYQMPILAMNRHIVMVGKVDNGYKLYSNQNIANTAIYDRVIPYSRFNNEVLTLIKNDLKGMVFESNGVYCILPCKYKAIYSNHSGILFGNTKFIFVTLPNDQEGYVRQDGKEFFNP
jgi:hypothetical protein